MKHTNQKVERLPLFSGEAMSQNVDVLEIFVQAKEMRAEMIAAFIGKCGAAVVEYLRARKNNRTLNDLSDATLQDIGLVRAQIPAVAKALANGTFQMSSASAHVLSVLNIPHEHPVDEKQGDLKLAA